ncbi:MAG: response regulator transcription factor [bacterium]|nr:response regulator transcription factor [bacterium]
MATSILVVEDERNLAEGIAENLEAEGYRAEIARDGKSGLEKILSRRYGLVILDVMLPEMDGFTVCEMVRRQDKVTPILFLTAKGGIHDRIRGLEAGGDDYLPKPFHLQELLLRIKAILRRWEWYSEEPTAGSPLRFGDNELDLRTFQARAWDGATHSLTHKEAMILKALAERPGEVISREDLLEKVWGYDVFPSTRTIDNFILRLRKRFEPDPENPRFFHTVRGVGYRFVPEGESS